MNKLERKKGSEIKVGKKEMDRFKGKKERMKKWMNGKEGSDVLKERMKTLMVERKEKSPRWEKWKEGENKMEVRE